MYTLILLINDVTELYKLEHCEDVLRLPQVISFLDKTAVKLQTEKLETNFYMYRSVK